MAQWVKDLILSLPWHEFDPWPRNKKKRKEKSKSGGLRSGEKGTSF